MEYTARLHWTGAAYGTTRDPATYSRDVEVTFGSRTLKMSAAPEFRGDPDRANPEQLFVASIASCQALTYLFLAARAGVDVVAYSDAAVGELQSVDGRMRMTAVTLRPEIVIAPTASAERARTLIGKAHAACFIANSVSTIITIEPQVTLAAETEKGLDHAGAASVS